MEPIIVEINSARKKVHKIIENYHLMKTINMEHKRQGDRFLYYFSLEKESILDGISIYNSLAKLIHHIIIDGYGENLINKRLIKILKNVGKEEKIEIRDGIIALLKDNGYNIKDKEIINNEIHDSLMENNLFNIDGYLRFRANTINLLIDKCMEQIIDDMEMESEYNEFIDMLQFYVDNQIPSIDLVNVIIEKDDFRLVDK